jgi:hypothetical protein
MKMRLTIISNIKKKKLKCQEDSRIFSLVDVESWLVKKKKKKHGAKKSSSIPLLEK